MSALVKGSSHRLILRTGITWSHTRQQSQAVWQEIIRLSVIIVLCVVPQDTSRNSGGRISSSITRSGSHQTRAETSRKTIETALRQPYHRSAQGSHPSPPPPPPRFVPFLSKTASSRNVELPETIQLKLVCHFSVKQKSGRKRKPREGEDPPLDSPSPRAKSAAAKPAGGKSTAALAAAAAASAAASAAAAAAAAAAARGGGGSSASSSSAASAATTWANGDSERPGNGRCVAAAPAASLVASSCCPVL